jgi:hypothetical protein
LIQPPSSEPSEASSSQWTTEAMPGMIKAGSMMYAIAWSSTAAENTTRWPRRPEPSNTRFAWLKTRKASVRGCPSDLGIFQSTPSIGALVEDQMTADDNEEVPRGSSDTGFTRIWDEPQDI